MAETTVSSVNNSINFPEKTSFFDGSTWQLIGYRLLSAFVNIITLGIAYPWMLCLVQNWETKHTIINGRRLKFTGHGHQLIGKYLLWIFITIITLGIYSIWLGLGIKKWVTKHTVYADEENPVESYFSGGAGGYFVIHIMSFLLTVFTLGIGKAWADKMVLKWELENSHIGGSPLVFNGTGGQLFVKYLLFALLTPLTLGIYALFFTVIYLKWQSKHTEALYQTQEIQTKARAHEANIIQDFAKYRISANDQEIAAVKSGYTGKENTEKLEKLIEENNPFAAYHLAKQLKGDNPTYEGKSLELLQKAANFKINYALCDLAKQQPHELMLSTLEEAAKFGNAEASWLLAKEFRKIGNLAQAAYWFRIALEWDIPEAKENASEYDLIINEIALQLSEKHIFLNNNKTLKIVLFILLAIVLFGVLLFFLTRITLDKKNTVETIEQNTEAGWKIYDVELMQSRPIDKIRGEELDAYDYHGNTLHYIFDRNIFFDYEEKVLYFEFAVIEYGFPICIMDKVEWKTEEITQSGIFKVSYPYDSPPEKIAVYGETFISSEDTANIISGTTVEAKKWLQDKYNFETPTDSPDTDNIDPTTPPSSELNSNLSEKIVGNWIFQDIYTNIYTGDDVLEIHKLNLNSDGTYTFSKEEYMVSVDGTVYYGGRAWMCVLASESEGTYNLENRLLYLNSNIEGEYPTSMTVEYQIIIINENLLTLKDTNREYLFSILEE